MQVPRFWSSAATLRRSSDLHTHSSPSLLLALQALVGKKLEKNSLELYTSCNLSKIFCT
jgi:hypothetical protein